MHANLARSKRELPRDVITLYMGHGEPATGQGLLEWQARYIEQFRDAIRNGVGTGLHGEALADAVTARMQDVLPTDDLLFLLRLSVEPAAAALTAGR